MRHRQWRGVLLRAAVVGLVTVAAIAVPAPASAANHSTTALWALDRLDQVLLQSQDHTYRYHDGVDGTGVTVYVLSTGTFSGTDLGGRVEPSLAFGGTKDADTQLATCSGGDGAALASLAAGAARGVAKAARVRFMQINGCVGQVYECNYFPNPHCSWYPTDAQSPLRTEDFIEAVDWVTDHKSGPSVGLIDYAVLGTTQMLDQALARSVQHGVTWVVPAGNDANSACAHAPAALGNLLDGVVTVGATTSSDGFVPGTSGGLCVDVFAPGQGVDSLTPLAGATRPAAAYTAGVIAQYMEPAWNWTPSQLESHLKTQATSGALTGLPANSPNLLLHSAWWGPVLRLTCTGGYAVGAEYTCHAHDLNGPSSTHRWHVDGQPDPAFDNLVDLHGECASSMSVTVRVESVRYNLHHDVAMYVVNCDF